MKRSDIRKQSSRNAFLAMSKLDKENGSNIVSMMREMVRELGVERTMVHCDFAARGIPAKAIEVQRLTLEYLYYDEPRCN